MNLLSQESLDKTQLLCDVWDGTTPKRVPLIPFFGMNFALEYAGYDPNRNIGTEELLGAAECIAGEIKSDIVPTVFLSFPRRPHSVCGQETIRCFSDLPEYTEIAVKYQKAAVPICGFASMFPSDGLIRDLQKEKSADNRMPDSVNQNKLVEQCCFKGKKSGTKHDRITILPQVPLFSDIQTFEQQYWPLLHSFCEELDENGYGISLILDHPWEQFTDCLFDLPAKTQMKFCEADAVTVKQKLGNKHILWGGYPTDILRKSSKENCCDKAKELLDILAPGGGYLFSFNNIIDKYSDINMEHLDAVLDTVMRYGKY